MANLKIEFQKPKLTLCNTNYTPLGILTNKTHMSAHNITLTSKVNETPCLSFDIPLGGLIDNNSTELLIKHKNDYFVIKNISMTSGDTSSVTVNAEHIACELKGVVVSYFEDLIGESPENMWETVITNCSMPEVIKSRYIFETNIVDTYRYLSGEDEKSVYEHLMDIAEQFEACLLFSTDADGIIHIKLLYGDIDRGKFIRKGKDLKQLNLNFSTDSLFTKVTPFGATDDDGVELTIMDVNSGKSYITNYDYYLAKGMTAEEIQNNPLCNQECIYRNTDVIDAEDLLRLGRQELDRLSKPTVSGTIEAIDLNVFKGSLYLSPILCEKIIVIDKDINYSISCKITEIEFTYDNPLESKIGISNVVRYSTVLKDLVQNSEAVSEILTNGLNGRPNLNASKVKGLIDGHIAQLKYSMEDNITDVTDAVILFENRIEGAAMYGALAIGSRGILISREIDPVTNQWVWTTALDSHGLSTQIVNAIEINASQIKGDILSSYDNSTWINLNDGEFNFKDKIKFVNNEFSIMLNNGETIDDFISQYEQDKENMTNDINDVSKEVANIKDNIDIVISDGVITEAEIVSIEKSIMQLQKEKVDIDTRYLSMVNNSYLDSELKLKLTTSYNNYTKAHSDFVLFIQNMIKDREITEQERADLDTYSSNYNTALATLKTDMDTCLSNIAENNTAYQIDTLKTKIDSDFQDVNNRLDNIIDDVGGVVADGIIEEAEVLIIQNSIKQLNKEKEDVDMIYNTLYNDSDVPTENKKDLKTKYEEYNTAHHELITHINVMIADKVATEEEKTTFDSLTNTYSTKLAAFKNSANIALAMTSKNYTNTQFNVLDDKISMRVTSQEVQTIVTDAVEESKAYSDTLFEGFQDQMDGIIETYYQSTDPSKDWTTNELKAKHTGDIWYDNLNNATYRWSGTTWERLSDAEAEQAYALATSKAKVFTSTPTTPYRVGDLWVQGSGGDIMKCVYSRSSGNYVSSDWAKASKYTDDSTANEVKNNLANNYYNIKQTDSAINVMKDGILSEVSSKYTTTDSLGNTLSQYATKSEMKQTGENITAKFIVNGGNLLLNGRPRNNVNHWASAYSSGSTASISLYNGSENNWQGEHFNSGLYWRGNYTTSTSGSSWCVLCNGSLSNYKFNTDKTYSISTIIYNDSNVDKQIGLRICDVDSNNLVCSKDFTLKAKNYQRAEFEFTPLINGNTPMLMFYLWTNGDYSFYIPWAVVKEGTITKSWIGNDDEVENGITKIDKDGIAVSHTNVNSVTKMMANGFYIEDSNGETIASLSSKEQWTELKADKVFANNIENIYLGDANLYVNHSNSNVGNGTADNPFNSFSALKEYLESSPIINKDLTINIVSTGNVSDNLDLRGLKGRGVLNFTINKNLVLNGNGANSGFYFYDCQNNITINGGRTGYSTSDGALINKFKYGVFFNKCKYGTVEYIAIDTSGTGSEQWGVLFRNTNGKTNRVDFCDTANAIFADMGSNVRDSDSCGNGSIAFYSSNASNIMFGSPDDNGYRPNGTLRKVTGNIVDLGNRAARSSFRVAPPIPPTSDKYQDFSFSDYGYWSGLYNNWNSIGYKTVYQGDWGYGNNRGIFTLPNSSISSFLTNATILDGSTITLQRENAGGYSASQTVYLWGTTQTTASGSAPPLTKSYGALGTLAWGEKKTFTLPKAFVTDLKNGTIKSVMFYTSDGSNYIKFSAVCTLRLKVNK